MLIINKQNFTIKQFNTIFSFTIKILSKELRIKYMTFHFIIIPCVQFHFRANTIYNVRTQRYYTYKKTKCKTDKKYRHKNSLLLICTEPIVHYVAITQKSKMLYYSKRSNYSSLKPLVPTVFFTAHCHWSQSISQTHLKLFIISKKKHPKLFRDLFPS